MLLMCARDVKLLCWGSLGVRGVPSEGDEVEGCEMLTLEKRQVTITRDLHDAGLNGEVEPGIVVIWTDRSQDEGGHFGTGPIYQGEGEWHTIERELGCKKVVFDTELSAIGMGLQVAVEYHAGEAVTEGEIPSDVRTALERIRTNLRGAEQWLVRRVIEVERQLLGWEVKVGFRWVQGHDRIEGNKTTDAPAKCTTPPQPPGLPIHERFIALEHINGKVTKSKWEQCRQWFQAKCTPHGTDLLHTIQCREEAIQKHGNGSLHGTISCKSAIPSLHHM